jgi:hypothetical protein
MQEQRNLFFFYIGVRLVVASAILASYRILGHPGKNGARLRLQALCQQITLIVLIRKPSTTVSFGQLVCMIEIYVILRFNLYYTDQQ